MSFEDLIRMPGAGPPTRVAWNKLIQRMRRLDVIPGPGMLMRKSASGTVLWPRKAKRRGGGGTSARCIPFKPVFSQAGDVHTVRFGLGLLNQMAATNWDADITIDAEATVWPVLNVTSSNGRITGYTIALDSSPPSQDQMNENTPPTTFKIVLGVIESRNPCMVVDENLEASAIEVFRESRVPPTTGEEPFTRWWRWKVNQNTAGEYAYVT